MIWQSLSTGFYTFEQIVTCLVTYRFMYKIDNNGNPADIPKLWNIIYAITSFQLLSNLIAITVFVVFKVP